MNSVYNRKTYLLIWLFFTSTMMIVTPGSAHDPVMEANMVYRNTIASVRFHPSGQPQDMPVYALNARTPLVLQFDDLVEDYVAYRYKIVHYSKDWSKPSELGFNEFMEGMDEQVIEQYSFSNNAGVEYTSYKLSIPNRSMQPTLSGNYCLIVWDPYTDEIVMTRRFMVVDNRVATNLTLRRSTRVDLINTHHEFSIRVQYGNLRPNNAQRELSLVLLQNGRWDQLRTDFEPSFFEGNAIRYDQVGSIVLPGGNEYRQLDLRSLGFRTIQMEGGYRDPKLGFVYSLKPDKPRDGAPHIFIEDLNGNYVIQAFETANSNVDPEYIWVRFRLKMNPMMDGSEVYVYGGLSDWRLNPSFKMTYNPDEQGYEAFIQLKQGFYHYQYAVARDGKADLTDIEGSHFETQNTYQVLVYYTPFGGRYDQLVGMGRVDSGL
jgi:hypothetical protein